MQRECYTSCIKINGIPLLPPLMTDTTREEMRRYKSLAIRVEDSLRESRLAERVFQDECTQADAAKPVNQLKTVRYSSDSDASSRDVATSDTNNSDSRSRLTVIEPVLQDAGERGDDTQASVSDVQRSHFEACSSNDAVNDTKSVAAADESECIRDAPEAATPNEDATSVDSWKPEVPRTLDIVPITLSNDEEDTSSSVGASKEAESPLKLSRQGSYVLDSPSPMLLAHMHTELTGEGYVPTCAANAPQRKQWNIAQPKTEWENKQFSAERVEALSKLECAARKSASPRRESDSSTESRHVNKSVGCTVAVEDTRRSDATPTKHNRRSSTDVETQSSLEKSESDVNAGALDLSSGEHTGAANGPEVSRVDEKRSDGRSEGVAERRDSSVKSSTPDELLMVYKEIEELHKRQMMELIYRQRKEQSLLQAEFQKQQTLLLAEIRKCATGTPRRAHVASTAALSRSLSSDEGGPASREARRRSSAGSAGRAEAPSSIRLSNRMIICPLDYLSSRNLYLLKQQSFTADNSPAAHEFDFARKVSLCDNAYSNNNDNNNNDNSNGNDDDNSCESRDLVYRNSNISNVSRQLFPLDSNTTRVPVLDTLYLDKHVRAVNTINAYARGYLVRRLMRTERVITLKKIYREALQCMLKLHVDAPLKSAEVDFLHRLQLQCDAASMNIVELFAQSPTKRMKVIAQDREIQESRAERPTSARSYSFATQKTLARKNLKEFESTLARYQRPLVVKRNPVRARCQTWTSDMRDKLMLPNTLHQGIRRSTSTGAVRKPWR
ncbi:PREDICTED: uncharacterized protein LOC105566780 [Vollenhovia emeryi]|uniref:uncharacterized protein LOC105566780 n=1 Tax=Vollenhovia emeryi TaxID=411798 RepID=UPI0005F391BB|nr:PREDICTED: uncharacterized protein LOC105566780 [Vollenhovia emeryi]